MADISEVDVYEAFRSLWSTSGVLIGWIPPGRVFHTTVWDEGVQYPICVITMAGTTQMLVDPYMLKRYMVKMELRFKREEEQRAILLAEIGRVFTGSDDTPTAGLEIDGATVLHSFPVSSGADVRSGQVVSVARPDNETIQYIDVSFDVLIKVTRDT